LFSAGASPLIKNRNHQDSLEIAREYGQFEVVAYLLNPNSSKF
jgi:hypothetical protein